MSDDEEYASDDQAEEEEDEDEDDEQEEPGEEEQEDVEEEEQEPADPPNPLTLEMLQENAVQGQLARVGAGLSYAYMRVDVSERELTDIAMLAQHIHVRDLNVSSNLLQDISALASMTHLLTLNASDNKVSQVAIDCLQFLQRITMNENRLKSLDGLACHPMLAQLYVEHNHIERFFITSPDLLINLTLLDLRGNKLTTTSGIYPPNLEELYLASNLISEIGRMEGLTKLKKLHLRENQITTFHGMDPTELPNLTYLNLRGNLMEEVSDIKPLKECKKLAELCLQETPLSEIEDYRMEVWAALDVSATLSRLDKDPLEPDEQEEAIELMEKHKQEDADALEVLKEQRRLEMQQEIEEEEQEEEIKQEQQQEEST